MRGSLRCDGKETGNERKGEKMSGHSKWATIKHKKGKTDAARGKVFTKLGRELTVAVKAGGPNPETNSHLRDVIAKCKAANMPNDNIQRSIKRAGGADDQTQYDEISYEGYGTNGVAVIAECLTDNRNRSAADIRHLFDKFGNGMGVTGCVSWSFDKKGQILVDAEAVADEEELMMLALDSGAEDFKNEDGMIEILSDPADFSTLREALETQGVEFLSAEIAMLPQNTISLPDEESVTKLQKLIDALEDNDDVQNVYHNAELPDEDD